MRVADPRRVCGAERARCRLFCGGAPLAQNNPPTHPPKHPPKLRSPHRAVGFDIDAPLDLPCTKNWKAASLRVWTLEGVAVTVHDALDADYAKYFQKPGFSM